MGGSRLFLLFNAPDFMNANQNVLPLTTVNVIPGICRQSILALMKDRNLISISGVKTTPWQTPNKRSNDCKTKNSPMLCGLYSLLITCTENEND